MSFVHIIFANFKGIFSIFDVTNVIGAYNDKYPIHIGLKVKHCKCVNIMLQHDVKSTLFCPFLPQISKLCEATVPVHSNV